MKLAVSVTYKSKHDNGDPHAYTYNYTYIIGEDDMLLQSSEIQPNLENSAKNISKYPEDLYFPATTFNGANVEGCELTGSTYLCKCWRDIIIEGDIVIGNGYNVNFEAGNEVHVMNNSNVAPESEMYIVPVIDYSMPMPEATSTRVKEFCKSLDPNAPSYQANIPTKSFQLQNVDIDNEESPSLENFLRVHVFPNPANTFINLDIISLYKEDVTVNVIDVTGKILHTEFYPESMFTSGGNRVHLNVDYLSNGYYFIEVKTKENAVTKKIIIQN